MFPAQYLDNLRLEVRKLRIDNARFERSWKRQKEIAKELEEEIKRLKNQHHTYKAEINQLEREKKRLEDEIRKLTRQRDALKGMVFKSERKALGSALSPRSTGKKAGGQKGHQGSGRKLPFKIQFNKRVFLLFCPSCHSPLKRTAATDKHTVTDLPHWTVMAPVATQYEIERQWCPGCRKEVHGVPQGVVPGARLGMNLITLVMAWRYQLREPFNKISELLFSHYGVSVSQGALVAILSKTKYYLRDEYEGLLKEIRGSPCKHADETGYRVGGENYWCWNFSTPKSIFYTIEETRGKGVPAEKLEGARGVLVRDDYGAYEKLPLPQQSCWAHLLRKSHEACMQKGASVEVKNLHRQLKDIFDLLTEDLKLPFNLSQRKELYSAYLTDLGRIINASYRYEDTKTIQVRIKNQGKNLLTALLYENVPLTNNEAERDIRKIVTGRKITGGSRTTNGAAIHAVNMSVIGTINKRKEPLLSTLQEKLFTGALGKTE